MIYCFEIHSMVEISSQDILNFVLGRLVGFIYYHLFIFLLDFVLGRLVGFIYYHLFIFLLPGRWSVCLFCVCALTNELPNSFSFCPVDGGSEQLRQSQFAEYESDNGQSFA